MTGNAPVKMFVYKQARLCACKASECIQNQIIQFKDSCPKHILHDLNEQRKEKPVHYRMAHLLFPAEHHIETKRHEPEDISEKEICEPIQTVMQHRKILCEQYQVHAPFAELKVPDHDYVHQHSNIYKKQNIGCLSFHSINCTCEQGTYLCLHAWLIRSYEKAVCITAAFCVSVFTKFYDIQENRLYLTETI